MSRFEILKRHLEELEMKKTYEEPTLDVSAANNLKLFYGESRSIPIQPSNEDPPTPDGAIEKSAIFLQRESEKGFIDKFDPDEFRHSMLRPAIITRARLQSLQKTSQLFDVNRLFQVEPFQKFWFSTDTVLNIKKELSKLPYAHREDGPAVISRFLEGIASVVRIMKHNQMLDNQGKQTKKQLMDAMLYFMNEAKDNRKKAIRYALQQKLIKIEELSEPYLTEFEIQNDQANRNSPNNRNKVKYVEKMKVDDRMMDGIISGADKMPRCYRISRFQTTEEQCSNTLKECKKYLVSLPQTFLDEMKQHKTIELQRQEIQKKKEQEEFEENQKRLRVSTRPLPRILSFPNTKTPEIQIQTSESQTKTTRSSMSVSKPKFKFRMNDSYWNAYDPLKTREGRKQFHPLRALSNSVNEFKPKLPDFVNVDSSIPFTLQCIPKADGPNLIGNIWTTSDLNSQNHKEEEEIHEAEEEEDATDTTQKSPEELEKERLEELEKMEDYKKKSYEAMKKTNEALKLLNSFNFQNTDVPQDSIVIRLQNVWEELGFTVRQKLELLIKYTRTSDESQKLKEALTFWNNALSAVKQFNHSYTEMKDFVDFKAKITHNPHLTCMILMQDVENSEQNVRNAANQLLQNMGDELIVNGKTANDLILTRHSKMVNMLKPYLNVSVE